MKYPEPPEPAMTVGPCMFGCEPKEETPLFTTQQMRAYARRTVLENTKLKQKEKPKSE